MLWRQDRTGQTLAISSESYNAEEAARGEKSARIRPGWSLGTLVILALWFWGLCLILLCVRQFPTSTVFDWGRTRTLQASTNFQACIHHQLRLT